MKAVHLALRGAALTLSALPASRAWENELYKPTPGVPYIAEQFIPATTTQHSFPAAGAFVTRSGLYALAWFALANTSIDAADDLDALLALYAPGSALIATDGTAVRIGSEPAPYRGQMLPVDGGWAVCTIRIPWAFDSLNP